MDISSEIAASFLATIFASIPFGLFQRFVGGGARATERKLGYVAQTCPKCKGARSFGLVRTGIASAFLFKPMGPGAVVGYTGTCTQCSDAIDLQATDYPAIEQDPELPLKELIGRTHPNLGKNGEASKAAFERFCHIREPLIRASQALSYEGGYGSRFAEAFAFAIAFQLAYWTAKVVPERMVGFVALVVLVMAFVPMLWLCQKMMDRYGSRFRLGTEGSFIATAAIFAAPAVFFATGSPEVSVGLVALAMALILILVLIEPRQFFEKEVKPKLVSALVPMKPSLEELERCLRLLRQSGEPCRFVEAQGLLKEIATAAIHTTGAKEAAPAPVPADPQGKCPNCGHRIPLDSIECPVPKCGAIFGEGSAWKVRPA